MPSRSRIAILAALLVPVLLVGVPAAIASPGAGVVDARNLPAAPLERVVVTWRHGPAAVPAAQRRDRLAGAVPGIRHAAAVSDDAAAYWIPGSPTGAAALGKLHALAAVPGVAEVAPDLRVTADLSPNDFYYVNNPHQWALNGPWGINAEPAWDSTKGAGVTIAIVDTGYRPHSEFDTRVLSGYDFISDTRIANDGGGRDPDAHDPGDWVTDAEHLGGYFAGCPATDSSWHGTHVTGIAAARGNNVSGIAGIAWDASILPVRVLGKCGGWVSDIAAAVRWAAGGTVPGVPANANQAGVINLSLSGFGECEATMQAAIDAATNLGATVVAAAGNAAAGRHGLLAGELRRASCASPRRRAPARGRRSATSGPG